MTQHQQITDRPQRDQQVTPGAVSRFGKLEFVKEDYSNIPQYFYLHHKK